MALVLQSLGCGLALFGLLEPRLVWPAIIAVGLGLFAGAWHETRRGRA